MQVDIITIGDEILIGQIVDTNSAFMAQELNKAGFGVRQITTISDTEEQILQAVEQSLQKSDIVLITGGLGPTKDDITKQTLCKFFHTELVFDDAVYKNIETLFADMPYVMNELTAAQAYVPKNSTVIQNKAGTAPIMWFDNEGKVVVSMPGVPAEMKWAMVNKIIPRLQKTFNTPTLLHRTLLVANFPESALAIKIADWENALPDYIKLAYLPSLGLVKLRLTGILADKERLEKEINLQIEKLYEIIGSFIFAEEDLPFEVIIGELLRKNKLSIATAESCTGGNIAHLITSIAGSSEYFKGAVVAYSNEVKMNLLGVSPDDLSNFGAVSQPVVEQMAKGAMKRLNTDIAVATSGVAGPAGGSPEKPVGTVWIAVCNKDKCIAREFHFGKYRDRNIEKASMSAFAMVKELIDSKQ
jgi:nicotinamide-nucleotide amidase